MCTIPVDAIDLGCVRVDSFDGRCPFSVVPYAQIAIMRGSNDMRVLSIPLDLGSSCKPIAEADSRTSWRSQIPAVDVAIYSAGCEDVWMMSGEVDVGYGSCMGVQNVLNWCLRAGHLQVPNQRSLV